ncbi:cell surface A33 antigen-like [Pseudorasbora parva]|uniref:cell surface A33 antigen-like n=1 Tax=Pseudorasbora parva TaxID=51549 RepID=UPI00351E24E6
MKSSGMMDGSTGTRSVRLRLSVALVLLSTCTESSPLTVDIPQNEYRIPRGDTVTIPCRFTPPKTRDNVRVIWAATPDVPGDPAIILTYSDPTEVKVWSRDEDRVTLVHDIPSGRADLQLQRVDSEDTRGYLCTVEVLNNGEDAVSDMASLIVLVAPSPPICTIEGEAEYYEDIKLTCRSEEGTPTPTYKWRSYDTNNISRPIPPKATDQNGVLSLYSITKDTSGFFICTSTNEVRSETCNLTLAVMPLNVCLKREPSPNAVNTGSARGADDTPPLSED